MTRFAANLSMLFTEVPLLERFERAARAGFTCVEIQFPYEATAQDLHEQLSANRLKMVLHNLPAGNWAAGDRGIACDPGRVDEFRAGIPQAIAYATTLGVPQLNCLAGKPPASISDALARKTFVENLRFAAKALKVEGLKLLIEPINQFDVPGFWLNRTAQAISVLDEVEAQNAFVQYDIYHAQRQEGDLAHTLTQHIARIAHIQVADNPGRHEPGTGEIHFDFLFEHLARIGYEGYIGCEYLPAAGTENGLSWLEHARRKLRHTG